MNTKKLRRISSIILVSFLITLIISTDVKVAFVYADDVISDPKSGDTTIADIVNTYYVLGGASVSNSSFQTALYNNLGSTFGTITDFVQNDWLSFNGTVYEASNEFNTAVNNALDATGLDIKSLFAGSVAGSSILTGAAACVASVGVMPTAALAGTFTGGFTLGTFCNRLLDKYEKNIKVGASINASLTALNSVPEGGRLYSRYFGNSIHYMSVPSGCWGVCYLRSGYNDSYQTEICNGNNVRVNISTISSSNQVSSVTVNANSYSATGYSHNGYTDNMLVMTEEEWRIYRNNLSLEDIPVVSSPDLIGNQGKLVYDETTQTVPGLSPQDVAGVTYKPVTQEQMNEYTDDTSGSGLDAAALAAMFAALLAALQDLIPDVDVNAPTPVNPGYDVDQPEQPDYPTKDPVTSTDITEGGPYTTPGLMDKFPFSIPADMLLAFSILDSGSRQAPAINWTFDIGLLGISYDFELDLQQYDEIAAVLRTLELIAFVIGLMVITRQIIGG